MVGEFVSPSSRAHARIDRSALCAQAGIPYYLLGQVSVDDEFVSLVLSKLTGDHYRTVATGQVGQRFEVDEPFAMSFDPIQLLEL